MKMIIVDTNTNISFTSATLGVSSPGLLDSHDSSCRDAQSPIPGLIGRSVRSSA